MSEIYIPKEGEEFLAFDKVTNKPHRLNPFVCDSSNNLRVRDGSIILHVTDWRFEKVIEKAR